MALSQDKSDFFGAALGKTDLLGFQWTGSEEYGPLPPVSYEGLPSF